MSKWSLGIVLFFALGAQAQLLDNSNCQAFTDDPFFNKEFVAKNKIKGIEGFISTKAALDQMRTRGLETYYGFDTLGRQITQYSTYWRYGDIKDTTVINYYYDENDRMLIERRNDVHGFYSYNYEYDTLGRIISESYCRDENIGENKSQFELGQQYVIMSETYGYQVTSDSHITKNYYNNNGLVYQKEVSHFDANGYLTEVETQLVFGKRGSRVHYEYNETGLVSKKIEYVNIVDESEVTTEYTYDDVGNLLMTDIYRNGEHVTNKEVLYYEDTMLIEAMLIHDVQTNYLTIIQYEYEFY